MAYKNWSKLTVTVDDQDDFLTGSGTSGFVGLEALLLSMGWTVVDGGWSTAHTYTIFATKGESDGVTGYVKAWKSGSYVKFQAGANYNSTTHTLVQPSRGIGGLITSTSGGFAAGAWGDLDVVFLKTYVGSLRTIVIFGRVPNLWNEYSVLAEAAGKIDPGSDVDIVVDTVDGFEVGVPYQFISATEAESGEVAVLSEIDSATTTLTFSTIIGSYSAGAYIGLVPLPMFCNDSFSGVQYDLSWLHYDGSGVIRDGSDRNRWDLNLCPIRYQYQPEDLVGGSKRTAEFLTFGSYPINGGHENANFGYGSDRIMRLWTGEAISDGDVLYKNALYKGVSTAAGTLTLTDAAATWTVNEWANKMLVTYSGTGAGMIRLIVSNTAIELTLSEDWEVKAVPDGVSYAICDNGYRCHLIPGITGMFLLTEEVD